MKLRSFRLSLKREKLSWMTMSIASIQEAPMTAQGQLDGANLPGLHLWIGDQLVRVAEGGVESGAF